jgi:endoglucanase
MKKISFLLFACSLSSSACGQEISNPVRLNQIGFYPAAPKYAVAVGAAEGTFQVKKSGSGEVVFSGQLSAPRNNQFSGKTSRVADFSSFQTSGEYVVEFPGAGVSFPFEIKNDVHREAAIGSLKGFYFQRVSEVLPEKYAGKWRRPAGHPDNQVLVHPSAASAGRLAGTVISSPGGWYDAGDYNKYIVNSGITMGTLLSLCEDFPDFCKQLKTDIPESENAVPDLLDEVLVNLRWMLMMQDPTDGGVYHKLTNPEFDPLKMMPHEATKPRYVVQKNTIATLDFAAVTAQASRVFKNYEKQLPGLADSCLLAAKKAWLWARQNPNVLYDQKAMNAAFDPDVNTGGYEDKYNNDEWLWAAAELYLTTGDDSYYQAVKMLEGDAMLPVPTWNQVKALAYYSLIRLEKNLTAAAKIDLPEIKKRVLALADDLSKGIENQPFQTVMGKTAKDFMWGSSSHAANQGITLVQAYRISGDKKYLLLALSNLDYLLGRNATGYSFLTGFGDKTPMHPHHRPSVADGIAEPVPGLLSGGPNPGQHDKCTTYPNRFPDESFTDDDCSYASNEIAINWNAPFVYLASAMEALQTQLK